MVVDERPYTIHFYSDALQRKATAVPATLAARYILLSSRRVLAGPIRARPAPRQPALACQRMGTKAPAVARLKAVLISGKHSPSLTTLRKQATARGRWVQIQFVERQRAQALEFSRLSAWLTRCAGTPLVPAAAQ